MLPSLRIPGLCLLLAAALVPLATAILRGPAWQDQPRADRHHQRAVPKTGGPAWVVAVAAGCLLGLPLVRSLPLVSGLLLAFALGRADDLRLLGSGRKWALQSLLLVAAWAGPALLPRTGAGPAPSMPATFPFPFYPVAALLAALVLQTALEIFDNLDAALGLAACGGLLAVVRGSGASWAGIAAGAGAGACVGFLFWNRPPARVHLGNAGSYPVAFLVSLLVLEALCPDGARAVFRPGESLAPGVAFRAGRTAVLLPLAWPLFDLCFVTCSRLLRGLPPWHGGRDHTTHRLARLLGSDRAAAAAVAAVTATGLALAWLILSRTG